MHDTDDVLLSYHAIKTLQYQYYSSYYAALFPTTYSIDNGLLILLCELCYTVGWDDSNFMLSLVMTNRVQAFHKETLF